MYYLHLNEGKFVNEVKNGNKNNLKNNNYHNQIFVKI